MKLFLTFLMTMFIVSCAHHHEKPEHHHHAYEKQCAYSVSQGDLEVHGNNEYKLEHGGKTYYFSSLDAKKKFEKGLEKNINKADSNWERLNRRR